MRNVKVEGSYEDDVEPWELMVQLKPALKNRILAEAYHLHKAMVHCCKNPDLVINYLDKGVVPKNMQWAQ